LKNEDRWQNTEDGLFVVALAKPKGRTMGDLKKFYQEMCASYCGIEDDNIYTLLPSSLGHPEIGEPPAPFESQPGSKEDSLLVHDPPKTSKK
jgi:hypothetical protein